MKNLKNAVTCNLFKIITSISKSITLWCLINILGSICSFAVENKKVLFLDVNNSPAEINAVTEITKKLKYDLKILYKNNESIHVDQAINQIKAMPNYQPEILMISGHHGTEFYGDNGVFEYLQLGRIFENDAQAKKAFEKVETIFLLGCSSGSIYLMEKWKKLLPNLKLILGYNHQAPLGNKPQGHHYITYFLEHEQELIAATVKTGVLDSATRKIIEDYNFAEFDADNGPSLGLFFDPSRVQDTDGIAELDKMFFIDRISGDKLNTQYIVLNGVDYCKNKLNSFVEKYVNRFSKYNLMLLKTPSAESKSFWGDFHSNYVNDKYCLNMFMGLGEDLNDDADNDYAEYDDEGVGIGDNDSEDHSSLSDLSALFKKTFEKIYNSKVLDEKALSVEKINNLLQNENFETKLFLLKYYNNVRNNFFQEIQTPTNLFGNQAISVLSQYNSNLTKISKDENLKQLLSNNLAYMQQEQPNIDIVDEAMKTIADSQSSEFEKTNAKRKIKSVILNVLRAAKNYTTEIYNSELANEKITTPQAALKYCYNLMDDFYVETSRHVKDLDSKNLNNCHKYTFIEGMQQSLESVISNKNKDVDTSDKVLLSWAQKFLNSSKKQSDYVQNLLNSADERKKVAQEILKFRLPEKSEEIDNLSYAQVKNIFLAFEEDRFLLNALGPFQSQNFELVSSYLDTVMHEVNEENIPFVWHEANPTPFETMNIAPKIKFDDQLMSDNEFLKVLKKIYFYTWSSNQY